MIIETISKNANTPVQLFMRFAGRMPVPVKFNTICFKRENGEQYLYSMSMMFSSDNLEFEMNKFAAAGIFFSTEARERIKKEIEQYGTAEIM